MYGPVLKYQILDKVIVFTIHPEGVKVLDNCSFD